MLNIIHRQRGTISVFLICILLPMVVFEGILIDISKLMGARTAISGAGELAQNGALASYDKVLYEVYGLFATCSTEEELEERVKVYFQETLQDAGIQATEEQVKSLMAMSLEDTTFSVTAVNNTSLANHEVFKNQILEYIKLRGPANFGLSMLDKIKAVSNIKKETEVVERELDFEEKLEKIEGECKKVYEACKTILDNTIDWTGVAADVNNQVGCVKSDVELVQEAEDSYSELKAIQNKSESEKKQERRNSIYNLCVAYGVINENNEKNTDELSALIENKRKEGSITIGQDSIKELNRIGLKAESMYDKVNNGEYRQALMQLEELIQIYKENNLWEKIEILQMSYEFYIRDKTDWPQISEICPNLEKDLAPYFEENNFDYYYNPETIKEYVMSSIQKHIEKCWNNAYAELKQAYDDLSSLQNKTQKLIEGIEKLKKKAKEAQKAGKEWETAIGALPEGSSRESMQSKYESEAKALELSDIDGLQTVANHVSEYYSTLKTDVQNISYAGYILKDTKYTDSICTELQAMIGGDGKLPEELYKEQGFSSHTSSCDVRSSIENDKFYQYLKATCGKEENKGESQEKKDAKTARKNMMEKGTESVTTADSTILKNIGAGEFAGLPSQQHQGSGNSFNAPQNSNEKTESTDKIKENATKTMDSAKTFLSGLETLLTKAKEDLLISMYGSQMFSYYTINTKQVQDRYTLAGNNAKYHLLSNQYNYLYGAEIEYLIWGKQNGQDNVNDTLLSIFGIRFLLNTIYAFTGDAEIKATTYAWAVAIAGWTGFGVPIVQSVLTVALALAESINDIRELTEGEDVVIYKSPATWVMKPSGFTKEVVEEIGESTSKVVTQQISNMMDKAEQITLDTIDSFETDLDTALDSATDALIDSAASKLIGPLQTKTLEIVREGQGNVNDIKMKLNEVVNGLEESVANPTTTGEKIEKEVFAYVKNNYINTYAVKISNAVNQGDESVINFFQEQIENIKKGVRSKLDTSKLFTEVRSQVSDAKEKLEQGLQEQAQKAISTGMSKLSDTMSNTKLSNVDVGGSVSRGAMLTLNYKEYIDIFLMLASVTNEEQVLLRMADLIQMNMQKCRGRGNAFSLQSTVTMVSLHAQVNVGTSFIGNIDSTLGTHTGGKMSYPITYNGVLGY